MRRQRYFYNAFTDPLVVPCRICYFSADRRADYPHRYADQEALLQVERVMVRLACVVKASKSSVNQTMPRYRPKEDIWALACANKTTT
jgi:hypothetical protein